MLLSHHPPSQYDRTLRFASLRLCARCTGVLGGLLLGLSAPLMVPHIQLILPWYLAAVALPVLTLGIAGFIKNESGTRPSNNGERVVFGIVIGASFPLSWALSPWALLVLLVLVVAGQFVSAIALRRLGLLEDFFNQYFEGAVITADGEQDGKEGRRQLLCNCDRVGSKATGCDEAPFQQ